MSNQAPPTPLIAFEVPPHLMAVFEKAEGQLRKLYGESPPATDLIRLWLACANSWEIVTEFERAVLDVTGSTMKPNDEGHFDERALEL